MPNPRILGLAALAPLLLACCGCQSDALAIDATIQSRHMPFGGILDPIFTLPTSEDIAGYTRCGDSALWTGHYLAAESYRYGVTNDPAALSNALGALAYLKTLVDVTGTDLLARCVVPINSPYAAGITSEEASNGIHSSGANYWVGNTSRDQYLGVFFGLGVAYDLLGSSTQPAIQALATRLLNFLTAHAWTIVMPDGSVSTTFIIRPDQQLGLLQLGRHMNPAQFDSAYTNLAGLGSILAIAPVSIESQDVRSSYFKFNLDAINLFGLIRLETDATLRGRYQTAYNVLRSATKTHMNAHFNMIDRALNGPDAARDGATDIYLFQWLQRSRRDFFVDQRGLVPSCQSPDQACDPLPIPQRVPADFLWQISPFQLDGGGSGRVEGAGIDYILPYWMGRYYGVVDN